MGWSSGTALFDDVIRIVLGTFNTAVPDSKMIAFLVRIINAFEGMDWDVQDESIYWEHHLVRKAFEQLHPQWFRPREGFVGRRYVECKNFSEGS